MRSCELVRWWRSERLDGDRVRSTSAATTHSNACLQQGNDKNSQRSVGRPLGGHRPTSCRRRADSSVATPWNPVGRGARGLPGACRSAITPKTRCSPPPRQSPLRGHWYRRSISIPVHRGPSQSRQNWPRRTIRHHIVLDPLQKRACIGQAGEPATGW